MSKKTLNLRSLAKRNIDKTSPKKVHQADLTLDKSEFFADSSENSSAEEASESVEKSPDPVEKKPKSVGKKPKSVEKKPKSVEKEAQPKAAPRKKRAPVTVKSDEEDAPKKEKWQPSNWHETLDNIREMRKGQTAPVDEMGCHKCADPNASEVDNRFQSLVALMLSSQTKDQVTYAAMTNLIEHGCSVDSMAKIPDGELEKLIYPVGFYKRKVTYIKRTAEILKRRFNGDIPRSVKELQELPGVGPKMAHICMKVAWGEVSGIGVDTHVHRISNRLKWVKKETKTPEETRIALEDWLPHELWSEVNHLLVGFGQEVCLPQRPKCSECINRTICPYYKNTKTAKA